MTQFDFLRMLHQKWCHFQSRERGGVASLNELRRWFANHAVIVDGIAVKAQDAVDFPITSFVLFPKHPVTLR